MRRTLLLHALRRPSRRVFLTAACMLGLASTVDAEAIRLALSPKPGQILQYQLDAQWDVDVHATSYTRNLSGHVAVTALESRDGKQRFRFHLTQFTESVLRRETLWIQPRHGVSPGPYVDEQMQLEEMDPRLNGIIAEAAVSRRGEVLSVDILSQLPTAQRDHVELIVHMAFAFLPDRAVTVDDTWTQSPGKADTEGEPLPAVGETEFRLQEVDEQAGMSVASIQAYESGEFEVDVDKTSMRGRAFVGFSDMHKYRTSAAGTMGGVFRGSKKAEHKMLVSLETGSVIEHEARAEYTGTIRHETGASQRKASQVEVVKLKRRP